MTRFSAFGRLIPWMILLLAVSFWGGCADDAKILETPNLNGNGETVTQSTCFSCHTSEDRINETTDFVPPAGGSSGAG